MIQNCSGYSGNIEPDKSEKNIESWKIFLQTQTLFSCNTPGNHAIHVFYHSPEKEDFSRLPHTLLEEMAWALMARPATDILFLPLHADLASGFMTICDNLSLLLLEKILADGYIAVSRISVNSHPHCLNLLSKMDGKKCKVSAFSRAALDVKESLSRNPGGNPLKEKIFEAVRYRLPRPVKIKGRQFIDLMRVIAGAPDRNPDACIPDKNLARQKTWEPAYPEITVKAAPRHIQDRIPVLMAIHWLELGGAEKFAVDLIKALPKNRFAVYVTTDVPSHNLWENEIKDHAEEIFHLPEFLPRHLMKVFYREYIKTRNIKLFHIHHAPGAYESLLYLRRFFPGLVVMDTLHIIELPPNTGGYPEFSGKHFSPFINRHHVISHLLKNFLIQRWQVSEQKVTAIYLNVDTDYFNPDRVETHFLRSKLGIPSNAFLVGFIGRMVYQKQPTVFVSMAKQVLDRLQKRKINAPVYFVMIGSGPLTREVRKKATRYRLNDRLFFHDEVSDTRPIYRDLDLVVMPSANEGLALVAYEAMAMKTPVIFSDVGAQSELIEPQYLIPPGKNEASRFADKVLELALFPEKLKTIGESHREYILEHHRAQDTFDQMAALYETLLHAD